MFTLRSLDDRLFAYFFMPYYFIFLAAYCALTYPYKGDLLVRFGIGDNGLLFGAVLIAGVANLAARLTIKTVNRCLGEYEADKARFMSENKID